MIGLPFISDLFLNVLKFSRGIGGRFVYCPRAGAEINADNFERLLLDDFSKSEDKQFPAVFMIPPISQGVFTGNGNEWEYYNISLFFLATTYYDGDNQMKDPNEATWTSTHPVIYDQHDMGRCARNFIWVLNSLARSKTDRALSRVFHLSTERPKRIVPIAFATGKQLSGVRLDFEVSIFSGCVIEDYSTENISAITLPEIDSHPEHNL